MEHYRENRFDTFMISTVSQGNFCFDTSIKNVSKNGLMMSDIPQKFKCDTSVCYVVVNYKGSDYKLKIKPSWCGGGGMYKDIGFAIIDSSPDWVMMVNNMDDTKDTWYG